MSSPVTFKHANNGQEVVIYAELIYSVLYLPQNNCTAVMASGGAMVPVTDTVADANKKILAAKREGAQAVVNNPKERKKHVRTTT